MSVLQAAAALLVLGTLMSGPRFSWAADRIPVSAPPPAQANGPESGDVIAITPPRVSYLSGDVSFWRPGAQEWAPAALNTPLAPGDVLYTAPGGNVEIQVGPRAFVRAGDGTQIGVDNHEPDFLQLRVTAGHAALDVRSLGPGHAVELDTPNAAFTIERAGYYHVDVAQEVTTFRVHRGGSATMTSAGGTASPIAASQQVVITGADSPRVEAGPAIELTAWDRWNYQRTDQLSQNASARYVAPTVYGTEALDQHGGWRTVETYGPVWVPAGVPAGWVPYSTGRWIWDPRFGWTWLDDAPWGWAPYHYGRWVFVSNSWGWAPGPLVVRPAYAPALIVFLGGGAVTRVGRPVCWAPLGWGEPLIPWWGRPGFVGVAWWGGWGGPRVVNNVVVNRATTINTTNITVYKNVNVTNAVVGVPSDRFGHGAIRPTRISHAEVRQLTPVGGAFSARPTAASLMPASGPAIKPPATIQARAVVATRAPHDFTAALRAHDLAATPTTEPARAPRLVPSPRAVAGPSSVGAAARGGPGSGPNTTVGTVGPAPARPEEKTSEAAPRRSPSALPAPNRRPIPDAEQRPRQPSSPPRPAREATTSRQTPPPVPAGQNGAAQPGREDARLEPRADRPAPTPRVQALQVPAERAPRVEPPTRAERPARVESPSRSQPPARVESPNRGEAPVRMEPPARAERPARGESPARAQQPERGERPARGERPERSDQRSDNQRPSIASGRVA